MSATPDCKAIEKGLKDLIFEMSGGESFSSKGLNTKLTANAFSLDGRYCSSSLENTVIEQNNLKLPFSKLNSSKLLQNQTNSSELIDLNALTEFTAKHIDDPSFKTPIKEIKLPHPDLEDDCHILPSNTGVSVLFEKIQNSPNFVNLPENPLQCQPKSPKKQAMVKDSNSKTSPSHKQNSLKRKKKKRRGSRHKEFPNAEPQSSQDGLKAGDVKVLEKENKEEMTYIKAKKSVFSSIGREYSLFLERNCYRFQCHICNYNSDVSASVTRHLSSNSHRLQKELTDKDMMLPFLPEPIPAQIKSITELLITEASLKGLLKEDVANREALGLELQSFVKENVSICDVNLIGSSAYGIGFKHSEVDFVIRVASDELISDALEALLSAISKGEAYERVKSDFQQKRPQIRFRHRRTQLPCNILIDNGSSLKLANLLSTYCKLDDRVPTLGAVIRHWAKLCNIDQQDRGTLPSFTFALLLVHFLQQVQPPVLPVLHEVEDYSSTTEFYEKYLKESMWKSQNTDSIGELWLKFFRFYTFDYKIGESVVCVRSSKGITCNQRTWNTKFYAIEEPFLKRNIAYVIPTFQVCQYIQNCFLRTYRYFAYPQLKKDYPVITLLKTEDFDALKLSEYVLKQPIVKPEESDDSEVSENEDSTSTDVLNISQDLEDHDPDIPLEDLISTVTSLSFEEETIGDKNPDSVKEEISLSDADDSGSAVQDCVTVEKQLDTVIKLNKSVNKPSFNQPPAKLIKQTPICYWDINGMEFSKKSFNYKFDTITLKGDKSVPLNCSICKKSGHLKKDCPIDEIPIPRPLPTMTKDFLDTITAALYSIWEKHRVNELHIKEVETDMRDVEKYIKEVFPDAKLDLFGSFCNGFGFRNNSDMDFCLTFANDNDGKDLDSADVIHKVAAQLRNHPNLENVIAITSAKVPIVKFAWKHTGLEGDISLYNTLALINTQMLEAYSKIDERVQILGYALKHFAKTLGICDASRGSLSSYAYILMVLYFLQQRDPPVIPVLQELYDGEKPSELVDNWNVWYYKDINKLKTVWPHYGKNNESVAQLWLGLLCFYACEFDWKKYVISIKQKNQLTRFKKLWISEELAIEDPFDLSHNLGGGLSRKMNTYILKAFIRGRERFGTPLSPDKINNMHKKEVTYFFNRNFLNAGCEPPHDRGCGNCGKIGHLRKDCPSEKSCSYCRKPGHLIKNCPRKRSYQKEVVNSKERNRFNYDSPKLERRNNTEKNQNQRMPQPSPLMRNDFLVHTFPGMQFPTPNQNLESQQKLLQMGVPTHRMPPPGFPPNPPPGFKTGASQHQKSSNYPPAFNSPHPHVPPFPRQVNKNELHSQSPPKHYGTSPPKNFQMNKTYQKIPESPGWPLNSRHTGFKVERHPNPQLNQGNSRIHWQARSQVQREPHPMQHKSSQHHHINHRVHRTNSDHLPFSSDPLDKWYSH